MPLLRIHYLPSCSWPPSSILAINRAVPMWRTLTASAFEPLLLPEPPASTARPPSPPTTTRLSGLPLSAAGDCPFLRQYSRVYAQIPESEFIVLRGHYCCHVKTRISLVLSGCNAVASCRVRRWNRSRMNCSIRSSPLSRRPLPPPQG